MSPNLFGLPDTTWLLIDQFSTLLGLSTGVITLILLAWGAISRDKLRRWLTRNRFPSIGGALAEDARYDGLVLTVSKPETPTWVLNQIHPKAAVLVASEQSKAVADAVKASATAASLSVLTVGDADDPAETRLAVRQAIERLTVMGCTNIAVDLTGGKVPMSLGAFMAAEEAGRDSLYVSAMFDQQLSKPDMRTAKITVVSRPTDGVTGAA